jgi:hypothetical protein
MRTREWSVLALLVIGYLASVSPLKAEVQKMKTARFTGKIEKTYILVTSDGPNYFVVNGKQVIFAEASRRPDPEPWGRIEGFGEFKTKQDICTTYNGQRVEVYAAEQQATGSDLKPVLFYTLHGSADLYVRVLHTLSDERAEQLAVQLVNQHLKNHPPLSWDGKPMLDVEIKAPFPGQKVTAKRKTRWEFLRVPTSGLYAHVVFDLDGANSEVSTSWSAK